MILLCTFALKTYKALCYFNITLILTKNFLIFQQVREELKHKKELDLQEITIPEEDDDDDDLR